MTRPSRPTRSWDGNRPRLESFDVRSPVLYGLTVAVRKVAVEIEAEREGLDEQEHVGKSDVSMVGMSLFVPWSICVLPDYPADRSLRSIDPETNVERLSRVTSMTNHVSEVD